MQSIVLSPLLDTPLVKSDILSVIADAVICTDEEGFIVLFNRAAEDSFGYTGTEVIGQHVDMLVPQADRAAHAQHVRGFAHEPGEAGRLMGRRREVRGLRKNGEVFPAEAAVSRHTVDGRIILTVVHRDITVRKVLEQQRETIAQELDHRIRNVLSVVSSIVSLTARSTSSVAEFKQALLARLGALARTQAVLRSGAEQSATISQLLDAELAQYRTDGEATVLIRGQAITVGAMPAQTLALVFHELATNSAKYGALSDPLGRVTVTCTARDDESLVDIEWRETGGPPVVQPQRKGFGTTLITQLVERTFGGKVVLEFPPVGLVCRMQLPRRTLEASSKS